MAVQGGLNSLLAKSIGLLEATFSVQLLAALTLVPILLPRLLHGLPNGLSEAPWYAWLGGPVGVGITYGVALSFSRLGAGKATTAIIVCQLLTAFLLDHFGWLEMEARAFRPVHLLGILLMAAGVHLLWRR